MSLEKDIEKRTKEGWIRSHMFIEVLAITEEAAKYSLEKHIEKLEKEKDVLVAKKVWKEIKKVEKPFQNIEVAYSNVVEIEILTKNYEKLIFITINYGPSSIEILNKDKVEMELWEAQGIVNTVADIIHHAASRGAGGIILQRKI